MESPAPRSGDKRPPGARGRFRVLHGHAREQLLASALGRVLSERRISFSTRVLSQEPTHPRPHPKGRKRPGSCRSPEWGSG